MRLFLLLATCVCACVLVGCGSDESSESSDLPSALSDAETRLDRAGFDVAAEDVEVLAKTTPVLVVTADSSASALVAENGTVGKLPNPTAGVRTAAYTVCDNDLALFLSKDNPSKAELTKRVCSHGS